ncbi:PRC-barrel domain-containing protein [Psychromarinibacter halotolerans]|uniref:PRC-barrel domain-containing protein n=1 Tax=Psychromarinibacter halotolerans TaxID=1775175 RepID=A0ABV7GU83_9RHOB|nr:PRC-barrel domain-containing protein [Psychromarinibacter halotolerans]MDF0598380.1 PRC-barrel domain-containing protein [Psychromarinibacter halotolerans]
MTTTAIISSDRVNGTNVYARDGEKIGHIDHLMIDKSSGRVPYAVRHFGGFLGLGEEEYPVPWEKLTYDTAKDGYVTDITREQVEGAPRSDKDWHGNRDYEQRLHDHYLVNPYWM